jgi:serine/threonine protein kinase
MGDLIGRYEILAQLGTGSMGTVYRARDTVLQREVALKTIQTGPHVDPELRERFHREALACAQLDHPNIVTVYDLGAAGKTTYIAMELLVGSDFRTIIDKKMSFPLDVKLSAMVQICEALGYAHGRGIVHRDVKPSNLFLLADSRAKVLDFGIARLPSSSLTVVGKILGTPNYMAPEQMMGTSTDGRADLFSAAMTFFELLVYAHPFRSSSIPRRIVEGDPDSLFDHDTSMPSILETVIGRGLEKNPARRYATGEEFAADLRTVLDAVRQNSSPTFSRVRLPSQSPKESAPDPAPAPAAADGTLGLDISLINAAPVLPSAPAPVAEESAPVEDKPAPPPPESGSGKAHRPGFPAFAWAGIAVLAFLFVAFAVNRMTAVKLEPPVATAAVTATAAEVYTTASSQGRRIATLKRGTRVNIVRVLPVPAREWVLAQVVENRKPLRPGYVKTASLGEWNSDSPEAALSLLRNFGNEGAEARIERLRDLAARFPGTSQDRQARLEADALEVRILARDAASGQAPSAWQPRLERVQREVADLRQDPGLKDQAANVQRAIDALQPPAAQASSPPTPKEQQSNDRQEPANPQNDTAALLKQADRLRSEYRYDEARKILNIILRRERHNRDAQKLLDLVDRAQKLENSTQ